MKQYETVDAFFADFAELAAGAKDKLAGHPGSFLLETRQGRRVAASIDQDGSVTISPEPAGEPDCCVTADEKDLLAIINGKLSPVTAVLLGKAKIKGNPVKLLTLARLA